MRELQGNSNGAGVALPLAESRWPWEESAIGICSSFDHTLTSTGKYWDEFATRPMHLIISVLHKAKPPWR
jgi:hypothetical protein